MIDNRIDGDRGLAGLAVADDQLTLTAADRDHAVDRLQAGLKRLFDGLARHDAGSFELDTPALFSIKRTAAIDRLAQRIDHAPDQLSSHWNLGDSAGPLDRVAFFDHVGFAEQGRADVIFFEVERDAVNIVGKLQQLAGRDFIETVNTRDTVTGGKHRADFLDLNRLFVIANLFFDNPADFRCADFHIGSAP